MTQRRQLLSGGVLTVAALIGFYAGHGAHAKTGMAATQAVRADSNPALPATFSVSAALPNMQLHYANTAIRHQAAYVPVREYQ